MDIFDKIYEVLNHKGGFFETATFVLIGVFFGLFLGATIARFVFGIGW